MKFKILKYTLLVVSMGFYCLPIAAGECPGHLPTKDEMNDRAKQDRDRTTPPPPCDDSHPGKNNKENWASKDD